MGSRPGHSGTYCRNRPEKNNDFQQGYKKIDIGRSCLSRRSRRETAFFRGNYRMKKYRGRPTLSYLPCFSRAFSGEYRSSSVFFARQLLDGCLTPDGRRLVRHVFQIEGCQRPAPPGVLGAGAAPVSCQPFLEVIGPAGVEGAVPALENVHAWAIGTGSVGTRAETAGSTPVGRSCRRSRLPHFVPAFFPWEASFLSSAQCR